MNSENLKIIRYIKKSDPDTRELWDSFRNDKLAIYGCVEYHIILKQHLFYQIINKIGRPPLSFLIFVIVDTLPSTWPKKQIFSGLHTIKTITKLKIDLDDIEFEMMAVMAVEDLEWKILENSLSSLSM